KAQLASARVQAEDAADLDHRFERIKGSTGISDSELVRRRYAAELAQARVQEAEAQLARIETEIDRLTGKAPIDGQVLRVNVRLGEFAQAGALATPLMVVGDMSRLHVRVEIDQTDTHRIRPEAKAVGYLRGDGVHKADLTFVRAEPLVQPKRSLLGDGS